MFTLDYQSRVPIYEQLKNQVTRFALLDILVPNEKLPSVRTLAQELGINPNTVQKAYQMLEAEGVICSVTGKGSFISADMGWSRLRRERAEKELRSSMDSALNAGVTKARVLEIADEIYVTGGVKV